ncbi:hypothetical protein GCM10022243_34370 [Saccharothrix violaceirubra]|uniref:Uncharacterized protein n=1 Tax=Saccharothrix violaceirubra TaxID=413306 RepID=A0A7W7T4M6_9PSEU|nr:hypothetical protein [Saccharothrix violaceirubra]
MAERKNREQRSGVVRIVVMIVATIVRAIDLVDRFFFRHH